MAGPSETPERLGPFELLGELGVERETAVDFDEIAEINPELLDILHDVRNDLGTDAAFEVISAYRSPRTNEMLRATTSGVAKNSHHVKGNAIDVRLRGTPTTELRDAAIELEAGGVGYYRKSDFVHVDTGRVRRW